MNNCNNCYYKKNKEWMDSTGRNASWNPCGVCDADSTFVKHGGHEPLMWLDENINAKEYFEENTFGEYEELRKIMLDESYEP